MAQLNSNATVSELLGQPSIAVLAQVIEVKGLSKAAQQFGMTLAELDKIRKKYGIELTSGTVSSESDQEGLHYDLDQLFFSKKGLRFLLFSFDGRITRTAYWFGQVVLVLEIIVIMTIMTGVESQMGNEGSYIGILALLFLLIPVYQGYAINVKRAHDRDRSGLFVFASLIPIAGIWVLIELGFLRSFAARNQYGPRSKAAGAGASFA